MDAYARDYRQLGSRADVSRLLDSALRSVDGHAGLILDVGAGEALTLAALRDRGMPGALVPLDLSLVRSGVARGRGFSAVVADAMKLPIRSASADLVICRHVIEHVPDDGALLLEFSRVLRPGGLAYIETPIRLFGAWYPYRNEDGKRVLDPTHLREYGSVAQVRRLVTRGGLEAIASKVRPIRYPIAHVLYRLLRPGRPPGTIARAVLDWRWPSLRIPRYREAQILLRAPGRASVGVARETAVLPRREVSGPTVSFVVPTRDSARTIAACLRSLRAQDYGRVHVVVVDNGSRDATPRIARELATVVLREGPERSRQRNMGAVAMSADLLVFIDADMVVPPILASEVVAAFGDDPACAGLVLPERSSGTGFWARCRILEKESYVGDPRVEAARAFRSEAFRQVGGYDETLHAGEDWDLADRVSQVGRIGRIDSFVVHDEGHLSLVLVLRKKLYYGRSLARYVRIQPAAAVGHVLKRDPLLAFRALSNDPVHGVGLVLLKVLELGAVVVGAALAIIWRRPAGSPAGQVIRRAGP